MGEISGEGESRQWEGVSNLGGGEPGGVRWGKGGCLSSPLTSPAPAPLCSCPSDAEENAALYNMACAYAQMGRKAGALTCIEAILGEGGGSRASPYNTAAALTLHIPLPLSSPLHTHSHIQTCSFFCCFR